MRGQGVLLWELRWEERNDMGLGNEDEKVVPVMIIVVMMMMQMPISSCRRAIFATDLCTLIFVSFFF